MDSPDPYRLDFEKSPLENGHPRGGGDGQSSGLQSSRYSSGPSDEPEGDAAEGVGEDIGARLRSIFGDAAEVSDGDEDAEGAATFGAAVREAKRSKVDGVGLPVGRVAAQRSEAAGPSAGSVRSVQQSAKGSVYQCPAVRKQQEQQQEQLLAEAGGLPSQPASGRAAQAARQRPQPSRSGQVGVPPAQAGVGAQPLSAGIAHDSVPECADVERKCRRPGGAVRCADRGVCPSSAGLGGCVVSCMASGWVDSRICGSRRGTAQ